MAHPQENYVADPVGDGGIEPAIRRGSFGNLFGNGDPNGSVFGQTGWSYIDLDSGDVYFNTGSGYNSVWTVFSGGGGGGTTGVFSSAASDPVADPGITSAIHYRRDNGNVWVWDDTAGQWEQVIG